MTERMQKGLTFTEIKWIPVKSLSVVWVNAQRPLNEKRAKRIADNFDPERVGSLSVTKPNSQGIYHIIDGQHRKVAVEMKWGKNEMVPCNVFDAMDPAKAAELFAELNTARAAPNAVDLFKVRVTAKSKLQVAIDDIARSCGFKIGYKATGNISCVGSLEYVYSCYGGTVLEAVLRTIKKIWGDSDTMAVNPYIIRGLGSFLSEFRHVDYGVLIAALEKKYTPARLIQAAKAAQQNFGGNVGSNMCDVILITYNKGVRSNAKKLVRNKKDS